MANQPNRGVTQQTWRTLDLAGEEGHAWTCTKCEMIIGGRTMTKPPSRCPMCAVSAGYPVALVPKDAPAEGARLSLVVLDRRFLELVDNYRVAKKQHQVESAASDAADVAGNYDLDGPRSGDTDAAAVREQQSAIALADAAVDRSSRRAQRASWEPRQRDSRTSAY